MTGVAASVAGTDWPAWIVPLLRAASQVERRADGAWRIDVPCPSMMAPARLSLFGAGEASALAVVLAPPARSGAEFVARRVAEATGLTVTVAGHARQGNPVLLLRPGGAP